LFFLGLAGFLLAASALLRYLTPVSTQVTETEFVTTNLDDTSSQFTNITYTGEQPSFPKELPLAQTVSAENAITQVLDRMRQAFSLTTSPRSTNVWDGPEFSLSYVKQLNQYHLDRNTGSVAEGTIELTAAQPVAEAFMKEFFGEFNLVAIPQAARYYSSQTHFEETSPDQAQMIIIPFAYTVSGYPVFYENASTYPFEVLINAQKTVHKVAFFPQFLSLEETRAASLISIETALANINRNKAAVIAVSQDNVLQTSLETIANGEMHSVSLEYRFDPATKFSYPFYRFAGQAFDKDNQPIEIELITPAIAITSR
jgi:hypothetical protein